MDKDGRKHKRLEIFLIVDIKSAGQTINYFLGMTKNLSSDGFSFESQNYEIKPGALLKFELKDPAGELYMQTVGKIIWKKTSDFKCRLGVQFQGLDKEAKKRLSALLMEDKSDAERDTSHAEEESAVVQEEEALVGPLNQSEGACTDANDKGEIAAMESPFLAEELAAVDELGKSSAETEESAPKPAPEPILANDKSEIAPMEAPLAEELATTGELDKSPAGTEEAAPKPAPKPTPEITPKTIEIISESVAQTKTQKTAGSRWYIAAVLIAAAIIAIPAQKLFHDMKRVVPKESTLEVDLQQQVSPDPELSSPAPVEVTESNEMENGSPPAQSFPETDKKETVIASVTPPVKPLEKVSPEPEMENILPAPAQSVPEADKKETVIASVTPPVKPLEKVSPEPERKSTPPALAQSVPEADKKETVIASITPPVKLIKKVLPKPKKKTILPSDNSATAIRKTPEPVKKVIKKPEEIKVSKVLPQEKRADKPALKPEAVQASGGLPEVPEMVPPPVQEAVAGVGRVTAGPDPGATEIPQEISPKEDPLLVNKIMLSLKRREDKAALMVRKPEAVEYQFTTYEDNFDDNVNNWDFFSTKAASARIEGGEYFIENKRDAGAHLVFHYFDFSHDNDYILEASVRVVSAPGNYSYGFVFGAKNAFSNYVFQVTGDKLFSVVRNDNGRREKVAGGSIKNISATLHNTLRIVKKGDNVQFFVNDKLLATMKNLSFAGNKVGFILDGKSEIAIDRTYSKVRLDR